MKKVSRNYQTGFVGIHTNLLDIERRREKARKVDFLLKKYAPQIQYNTAQCLDIGCAAGLMTSILADFFGYTIGAEYDFMAIRDHPSVNPRGAFICSDAMALPFPKNCLDVIICAQVYEHVPDDTRLVAEMYRVLRPGGVIFFSGPNKAFPIELHYNVPFLQWLPQDTADTLLHLLRKGNHFYERLRTGRELRQLFNQFLIMDASLDVILNSDQFMSRKSFRRFVKWIPVFLWRIILPLVPNFNWILVKPRLDGHEIEI